jgi:hypothetical protein
MQFKFAASKNMDFLSVKQLKSGEHVSDICASSSTEEIHGFPVIIIKYKKREKMYIFPGVQFNLSNHEWRKRL